MFYKNHWTLCSRWQRITFSKSTVLIFRKCRNFMNISLILASCKNFSSFLIYKKPNFTYTSCVNVDIHLNKYASHLNNVSVFADTINSSYDFVCTICNVWFDWEGRTKNRTESITIKGFNRQRLSSSLFLRVFESGSIRETKSKWRLVFLPFSF